LLVASLVTVVLNYLLRVVMTFLSKREFHETNAEEQRAIVVKIFGTTYINMACVVLLAYGFVRNEPQILVQVLRSSLSLSSVFHVPCLLPSLPSSCPVLCTLGRLLSSTESTQISTRIGMPT
jgi:hypothetical protein